MILDTKKFNNEIRALKSIRGDDYLFHPLRRQQIKESLFRKISEKTENGVTSARIFRYAFSERRTILMRYAILVLLGLMVVGGTVQASDNALPGDILYPVKRAAERMRLTLAVTEENKAAVQTRIAEKRSEELDKVFEKPDSGAREQGQAQNEVKNAIDVLTQVKVKLQIKGNEQAAESVTQAIDRLQSKLEEHGEIKIQGQVQSTGGGYGIRDENGAMLKLSGNFDFAGMVGETVKIEGELATENTLEVKEIKILTGRGTRQQEDSRNNDDERNDNRGHATSSSSGSILPVEIRGQIFYKDDQAERHNNFQAH